MEPLRPRIVFDVDPETKKLIKASAALEGQSVSQWCNEAAELRLERKPNLRVVKPRRKVAAQ